MKLKFKNRIAFFNTLAVAGTTALVFAIIYIVVYKTSYYHLDNDILTEKEEVLNNLDWQGDSIIINKMPEWEEAEHSQVEVNPTFLQIANLNEVIIFQSANLLKNQALPFHENKKTTFFNGQIDNQKIRLGQFPVLNSDDKTIGILTIAVSQEESYNILNNLILVLLISFPFVLGIQFITSSIAASRAIKPVHRLINAASGISDTNIDTRLTLPEYKDELYELTETINALFSRIEKSMIQQKQFTSDASHEIRTPLSAIRGTLEVLIRKQREPEFYESKIRETIQQVDRLDALLEQLLHLTRVDSMNAVAKKESINLFQICSSSSKKWKQIADEKNITIQIQIPDNEFIIGDQLYLELIFDNLLNNAIKYGKENGNILVVWDSDSKSISVKDDGIGISEEHLPHIFNRFYRAEESRSSLIKGNGLGLSIVHKLADLQQITLSVESKIGVGSTFTLHFHN